MFLPRQLWKVNYYIKKFHQIISVVKANASIFVVFKTKRELKCQNELFLSYHFSENTECLCFHYVLRFFDIINDDPLLR